MFEAIRDASFASVVMFRLKEDDVKGFNLRGVYPQHRQTGRALVAFVGIRMDIDEMVAQIYTDGAEAYASDAEPHFASFAERVVELAALRAGDAALDIGCGTGLVTFAAARKVGSSGSVVGLDLSDGQLAVAERHRERLAMHHVSFVRRNSTNFSFDVPFDAVLCSLGLPIRYPETLRAAKRSLRSGGRIAICVWADGGQPFAREFRNLLETHRTDRPNEALARLRTVREQLKPQFSQLGTSSNVEEALRNAGFVDITTRQESIPDHYESWQAAIRLFRSWKIVHAELAAMNSSARATLEREFASLFGQSPRTEAAEVLFGAAVAP